MLVKLLNGDILSVDTTDFDTAKSHVAQYFETDVEDIHMSSGDDDMYMAVMIRPEKVFYTDLTDPEVVKAICNNISRPEFVNESLIRFFLSNPLCDMYASNPHPLIVEHILTNTPMNSKYLVRNPAIVNHPHFPQMIEDSPSELLHNTNPRAREMLLELLERSPQAVTLKQLCSVPDDTIIAYVLRRYPLEEVLRTCEFLQNPSSLATHTAIAHFDMVGGCRNLFFFFMVKCAKSQDPDVIRWILSIAPNKDLLPFILDNPCDAAVDYIFHKMDTIRSHPETFRKLARNPSDRLVDFFLTPEGTDLTTVVDILSNCNPRTADMKRKWLESAQGTWWHNELSPHSDEDTIVSILEKHSFRCNDSLLIPLVGCISDMVVRHKNTLYSVVNTKQAGT